MRVCIADWNEKQGTKRQFSLRRSRTLCLKLSQKINAIIIGTVFQINKMYIWMQIESSSLLRLVSAFIADYENLIKKYIIFALSHTHPIRKWYHNNPIYSVLNDDWFSPCDEISLEFCCIFSSFLFFSMYLKVNTTISF